MLTLSLTPISMVRSLKMIPSIPDMEASFPEMSDYSRIMTTQQISMLYQSLSVSSKLHPWTQLYALSKHGCSLNTLYSKIQSFQQCNLLLIIQDIHRNVFGAFLSSPTIRAGSKSYTGTPETYVFSFQSGFSIFKSSGQNNFYVQSSSDQLVVGGWKPAIWLDANTDRGSSGASSTFNNDPLTTSEEFQVKDLECWAVSSQVAEQLGVDTRRDFCGEDHLIPCTPAFIRWKMMEDCRSDDLSGSPFIESEGDFVRRKAFEEEAANESYNTLGMCAYGGDDANKANAMTSRNISNLIPHIILSPDWTNTLHV